MGSKALTDVVQKLALASKLEDITQIVAQGARAITGADGATFVLRDGDKCYYVDENAISPLWKGGRFPLTACISGWSMLNKKYVIIPDIYFDSRIPHDVYRPTFVKSLCMVPIREEDPLGAIGSYWANGYVPNEGEIKLLQALANSTAIAIANIELKNDVLRGNERKKDLEAAIHTLAHDLRSPLCTVLLLTELIDSEIGEQADPQLRKHVAALQASNQQMNDQINRMLSLYGITNRKLQIENVNLSVMADEIAHDLTLKYPQRSIDFKITPGLSVAADKVLIRVAMENLLGNAAKYTGLKPQALIEFAKQSQNGKVTTFAVRDNGDGFEPADADKLFRPLVRLHTDQEFKGTGLGLASVARIIEMHGGSIKAEGRKSVGAAFFFDLP